MKLKGLLFAVLALLSVSALGQTTRTAKYEITTPTATWDDGSKITGTVTYKVLRGPCGGAKTLVAQGQGPFVIPGTVVGQCFSAIGVVDGRYESLEGPEAVFRGRPGAPTGAVTVEITVTVTP